METKQSPSTSTIATTAATAKDEGTGTVQKSPSTNPNTDETKKSNKSKQTTPNKQSNDSKKQRKPKDKKDNKMQNAEDHSTEIFRAMRQQVTEGLMECESGQELEVLQTTLRPDFNVLWLKCLEVKKDLIAALQPSYRDVRLEVFGSTVMGIAFKDSDFDFYVQLSRRPLDQSPAAINGKAIRYLGRTGNFTNFIPISHARVPILKCYHVRTGYQCDINFSDSYGILNSPIVARLLSFDARIYVLATIIKYWSKLHDCAGRNRISNYAIIWMLLFYLQQLDEPIVPPIMEFQKRVPPFWVNTVFNFAFDLNLPNQTHNKMRCSELLLGFFKFYKDFDYQSTLICPLYGKSYKKCDILAKKLPEFQRYEEILTLNKLNAMSLNKCLCIQDPFEITHSIPGLIAPTQFQKIVMKFQCAADIMEAELADSGESTRLLLKLFDCEKFDEYVAERIKKRRDETSGKQGASTYPTPILANDKTTIPLEATGPQLSTARDILMKRNNDANVKIDRLQINRFWAETMIEFLVQILREIFLFEIESDAVESSDKLLRQFKITGTRDVFLSRKQRKHIHPGVLPIEIAESKQRFEKAIKICLKSIVTITTDLENLDKVSIEFEDEIQTKKNNSFKSFITTFVQNINHLLRICFVNKSASQPKNYNNTDKPTTTTVATTTAAATTTTTTTTSITNGDAANSDETKSDENQT